VNQGPTPLIVGAGPTGLAAALFLHERGCVARVIDAAAEPSPWSKALGVNPRTLELLESSGVTDAIRAEGLSIDQVEVGRGDRRLAVLRLDYAAVGARHPMTVLPQARTEALLAEALAARGVSVERAVALSGLSRDGDRVSARLAAAGGEEAFETSLLLGADGAHSAVREAAGIGFPGDVFPETWSLADLELEGPTRGSINLQIERDGPLVAIPYRDGVWRVIAKGADPLGRLPKRWTAGPVRWRSEFRIAHRLADRFTLGRICLAGDAAHIHSPVGARGMNLGVEDAYVFAACAAEALSGRAERLGRYDELRRPVVGEVVRNVRRLTEAARADGWLADALRRVGPRLAARLPALRRTLLRQIGGLDHPVRLA